MGIANWKCLGLGLLTATCVLGSTIDPAYAGSTTVNVRVPAQPVGGTAPPPISTVRMTLEVTGVTNASTITVTRNNITANVATLTLPSAAKPIYSPGLPNEDRLSAFLTGNRLDLILLPITRQGGTQCAPDSIAAAQNGDYAITITDSAGNPAVTSFRLTSYSAPTGTATTNCSCNSRRRTAYAALWNPAPAGAVNKGRHPMNISLVLDHSGSMSSSTNGDPNPAHRRWDTLTWSVEQFVKNWAVVGGVPDVGGTNIDQDALSVVFFDSSVIPSTGAGASWIQRGSATAWDNATHPWVPILTAVAGQGPNAATSIGGGLQVALDSFQTQSGFDKTIILMTDGIQNTPPCVRPGVGGKMVIDPTGGCPGLPNGSAASEIPVTDQCTRVITIGMGEPNVGSLEEGLLDALAQQTDGQSHLVSKETDLGFAGTLVEALKGNTVSLAARQVDTIAAGAPRSMDVTLDSTVRSATFVLSWAEGSPGALRLAITDPNGKPVKPAAAARDDRRIMHYIIERVDIGKTGPAGVWKANLLPSIEGPAIPYHLSVYTEEQSLEFRLGFQGDKHGTGQPLVLANDIAFDDAVLAGVAGQIRVEVETPAGALGTLLRQSEGAPNGGGGGGPDPVTAYRQKADQVLSDPENLKKVGTQSGGVLAVTEPTQGHYEVALDPTQTRLPGTYRFHVTLDLPGKNGERVKRSESIETQVQVLPDPAATNLTVNNKESPGDVDLVIVPRDRFGNYVGPGYNNWFTVDITGPGSARGIDDNSLTGTYTAHLSGINPLLSRISVRLGGHEFLQGTVADFRVGRKFPSGNHCIGGCCCDLGGPRRSGPTAALLTAALLALVLLGRRVARR